MRNFHTPQFTCRVLGFALASLLALLVAAPALQAQPGPNGNSIRLKAATFDPIEGVPSKPGLANVSGHGEGVRGGFLVQYSNPISDADREALEAAGAAIKGYIPDFTLEVVMTDRGQAAVRRIPGVRWVGPLQPSLKVSDELLAQADADPGATLKLQVSLFPREGDTGVVAVASLGAQVLRVDRGQSFEVAYVEVSAGQLRALARSPLVRFIEPEYEIQPHNDLGRTETGLATIADDTFTAGIDTSLDGHDEVSGFRVKYGHFDGGLYPSHPDFGSASVTIEPGSTTSAGSSAHGTHTAASVIGDGGEWASVPAIPPGSGSISTDKWRGMTPQAALHHISLSAVSGDRAIFEREVEEGAQISTNSWGWCKNGCSESVTDYSTNSQLWDEGVWDADDDVGGRQPLIVFFPPATTAAAPPTVAAARRETTLAPRAMPRTSSPSAPTKRPALAARKAPTWTKWPTSPAAVRLTRRNGSRPLQTRRDEHRYLRPLRRVAGHRRQWLG